MKGKEDVLNDYQCRLEYWQERYAAIIAQGTNGKLSQGEILDIMLRKTSLSSDGAVAKGIAHGYLEQGMLTV